VFLDRDGVVIEDTGYLHSVEQVRTIPGSIQAIARLNRQGWPAVLVTNQSGIARGLYGWQEFENVQREIDQQLALAAAWLDGVWACGIHPQHPFRKPEPGMLLEAAEQLRLDLSRSWLIGDKAADLEAAFRAGLRGAILTETGYGAEMREEVTRRRREDWQRANIRIVADLAAAVELILNSD
jgi:D-glycero-D-manno-heptose 1,7-bisphosphate phosphatase